MTTCLGIGLLGGPARAQDPRDDKLAVLQSQLDAAQAEIRTIQSQLKAMQAVGPAKAQPSAPFPAARAQADAAEGVETLPSPEGEALRAPLSRAVERADAGPHGFLEHKPGAGATFYVPHGEATLYGNIDLSLDAQAKNVGSRPANYASSPPVGNWGWLGDVSTNISYIGVRGVETLAGGAGVSFVYQLEAGFDISATPGLKQTNSSLSDTVNGALFNRNTFAGFSSPVWGSVKLGKTDAPYKTSTIMMNPFLGELGDYGAIMGNTGGDSRVEFGTRLDHALWYESPNLGGLSFNLLYAPGQNRDDASGDLAAGESDCTGGNIPESGGDSPVACNDGAFSDAVSASALYRSGPLYLAAAGEVHQRVNRQSDISGMYGTGAVLPDPYAQALYNEDVAREWAVKAAVQYTFPTGTSLGAIGEYLQRDDPKALQFQDERTRFGSWVVLSQALTAADSLHLGWAHAFKTPGDPGQHNDSVIATIDGFGAYASNQNQADLLTLALKHMITPNLMIYSDWAMIDNGPSGHFALGAGGRGVSTDCHDASDAAGGADSNPHCYTGQLLMGVSAGVRHTF